MPSVLIAVNASKQETCESALDRNDSLQIVFVEEIFPAAGSNGPFL